MSYEEAPGTKLLATHCCCCQRPLLDAQSVELGIGPVCRQKHGWDEILALTEDARVEANKLVHLIACKREGTEVVAACKRLFEIGAIRVVTAILKRLATVQIGITDDTHPHGCGRLALKSPYSAEAVEALRKVPGRRWDKDGKLNTFPQSSKAALFETFKALWPGQTGIGPKGPFIIPSGESKPEPTAASAFNGKLPLHPEGNFKLTPVKHDEPEEKPHPADYYRPEYFEHFQKLGGTLDEAQYRHAVGGFFALTLDAYISGTGSRETAWEAFASWLQNLYPEVSPSTIFRSVDEIDPYT